MTLAPRDIREIRRLHEEMRENPVLEETFKLVESLDKELRKEASHESTDGIFTIRENRFPSGLPEPWEQIREMAENLYIASGWAIARIELGTNTFEDTTFLTITLHLEENARA